MFHPIFLPLINCSLAWVASTNMHAADSLTTKISVYLLLSHFLYKNYSALKRQNEFPSLFFFLAPFSHTYTHMYSVIGTTKSIIYIFFELFNNSILFMHVWIYLESHNSDVAIVWIFTYNSWNINLPFEIICPCS